MLSWVDRIWIAGHIALVAVLLATVAYAQQLPPTPVSPRACEVTTVTTGGTAVNAITGPATGFYIANPLTLTDQGIAAAEPLLISPSGAATAAANVATMALIPGAVFSYLAGTNGNISVNAATSGHKFTCVRW